MTSGPTYSLLGHCCVVANDRTPGPSGWTHLTPDPDVVTYQEAVTRRALAELRPGDVIEIVDDEKVIAWTRVPGRRPPAERS